MSPTPTPRALITGIAGQDGSYLADLLLEKGYEVYGIERPQAEAAPFENLKSCGEQIRMFMGDIQDRSFVGDVFKKVSPTEVYHLAGITSVSFDLQAEAETLQNNILGTQCLLAATKERSPQAKFFYAGSSQMLVQPTPMANPDAEHSMGNELLAPRSVYGIAKLAGHHLVHFYRTHHKLNAATGILYNHESPRRGERFVTQKIARAAARIKRGLDHEVILGNLDTERDWGHAKDFVRGFWLQLQQDTLQDYVFCTGRAHTVRDFAERAFAVVGLDYRNYVKTSEEFIRPKEPDVTVGDANQTTQNLGWTPQISFDDLVLEMVEHQLQCYN